MTSTGGELIVAYDIADSLRRERVSRLLSGLGPRVQLSVFESLLPATTGVDSVVRELTGMVDDLEDQIRIYRVAGRLDQIRTVIGRRRLEERLDFWIV